MPQAWLWRWVSLSGHRALHAFLMSAPLLSVVCPLTLQVIFLHPTPTHPHIYSNGHICLDILYDGANGGWWVGPHGILCMVVVFKGF